MNLGMTMNSPVPPPDMTQVILCPECGEHNETGTKFHMKNIRLCWNCDCPLFSLDKVIVEEAECEIGTRVVSNRHGSSPCYVYKKNILIKTIN